MKCMMKIMALLLALMLAACGGGSHNDGVSISASSSSSTSSASSASSTSSASSASSTSSASSDTTAPSIVTQPVAQSVVAPAAAVFSVTASGTAPLSYQWRSSTNGTDWTDIGDATTATYNTGATDAGMNGRYYSVMVSNSAGQVTSASVQLGVSTSSSGGSDGPLQPLSGDAEPFSHTAAPLSGTIASGSASTQSIISWDPKAYGFQPGLTHTNGAQTRLFMPGGVFRDEVFIRITELTDIGPQVSAVLAAVRIEPGDLMAEKTITATFTIPTDVMATVDVNQMIGFAADADGSNLHLMPIVPGTLGTLASRPGVQINHLGIVGIAVATPAQQAALAAAWPTEQDDQIDAVLAPALTAKWRIAVGAPAGNSRVKIQADGPAESPFAAQLRGYFNDVVVPAFAAAYGDPAQIPAAIQNGLTFLRNAALTGTSEAGGEFYDIAQDLTTRINSLLDTYADYVADQCRNIGGPPQLQQMLGVLRTLQLMGHDEKAAQLDGVVDQCSHFKATFRHDFTRNGHWSTGGVTTDESIHTIVEGTTTLGLNQATVISPMRLTTAVLDRTSSSVTGTGHATWEPESDTSPWGMFNLSTPVLRTRSGTPSTSVELSLHAFTNVPLQVTETTTSVTGSTFATPDVPVSIPLTVPALPKINDTGGDNFGPMLIPSSGITTSQITRVVPYPNGGSATEHEEVTVTLMRDE